MRPEAYRRARKLLDGSRAFVLLHGLGLLQVVLVLGLLTVLGLALGLVLTRGVVEIPAERPAWLPRWVAPRLATADHPETLADAGLLAVATPNLESTSPLHRAWGRFVLGLATALPPLRDNFGALLCLMSVALGIVLSLTLVGDLRARSAARLACELGATLRRQIHRQMYRLGSSALPSEGIESTQSLFNRSVDEIVNGAQADLTQGWRAPLLIGVMLLIALLIDWPVALALVTLGILGLLATRPLGRRAGLRDELAARNAQVMGRLLQEDLGMMRTVRVFGMESVDNRRFDEHLEGYEAAEARRRGSSRFGGPASLLLGTFVVLALILVGVALLQEPPRLSPAGAIAMVAALLVAIYPALDLRRLYSLLRSANRSATVFYEFLDRKPEIQQTGGAQFLPPIRDRIRFENVSVNLPTGKALLEGVDLEIPAGSRVVLMGRDDEAKQALVCLVPRLIDPAHGKVRIDGHDLKSVTLESLRAQISMVLHRDILFSDSVAANIGLGDESFPLPRIIEAAKLAHAHNFVQDLPNGYDTTVGPLGHYLRADEQYRIGLARAYLHDPSILILEEPPGHLDDEVKTMLDDTLARMSKGRTLILLPHRLSTIRSADQVVILHNGRIEAIGTPKELQATSKIFRHLQYVEFNQFASGEIEAGQMSV